MSVSSYQPYSFDVVFARLSAGFFWATWMSCNLISPCARGMCTPFCSSCLPVVHSPRHLRPTSQTISAPLARSTQRSRRRICTRRSACGAGAELSGRRPPTQTGSRQSRCESLAYQAPFITIMRITLVLSGCTIYRSASLRLGADPEDNKNQ